MGTMKNYLLTVLENCSEENFGQDAVEWAIATGRIVLTYNLPTDLHQIFDQRSACCDAPPQGETCNHAGLCRHCRNHATFTTRYDEIIAAYQRHCREGHDALMQAYQTSGLLEEILRPVPLAVRIPQTIPETEEEPLAT